MRAHKGANTSHGTVEVDRTCPRRYSFRMVRGPRGGHGAATTRPVHEAPIENAPLRPPIALVLIDDNRLLREGIAATIHSQPGFEVLAALRKVREARTDVLLIDFGLADHDSLSLTATVH